MIFSRASWSVVRLEVTIISNERMLLYILYIPSASSDYTAISRSLVFNGAVRSQMVTVSIRDDIIVEDQFEQFFINLRNYWNDSAVILNGPTTASVTIEDNDGELSLDDCVSHYQFVLVVNLSPTSVVTIGFNGTNSVREDAGSISIVVLVLMNSLARDVVVTLSTLDDTAIGRFVQCQELPWIAVDYLPISVCSWDGLHTCI